MVERRDADAAPMRDAAPDNQDAAPIRDAAPSRDAAPARDASTSSCPANDPESGTACQGDLRCRLKFHGDCSSPQCPMGCVFRGFSDNVASSGGISYYAVCRDGAWTRVSEGACHDPASVVCDCAGTDAGD